MFEDIVQTVREPLIVLDPDLRVLSANRSFYDSFKVIPEETIGNLIYDLGNRQWDIPGLRTLLEDILPQNDKFEDYEVEHIFPGVGHKIMLLNARRIIHKDIGTQMILLAIEDITERRRVENELKDYEERFRRLFETAQDGLLLIDKQTGNIVNVNPAIVKLLGYSSEELIGEELKDIGLLKDIKDFKETIRELIKAGFIDYSDVLAETKQGRLIDVDIYLVDRARFIQCNVRDVTERKEAQEALKRAHDELELRVEERTKGLFTANAALQTEISQRKLTEEALKLLIDRNPVAMAVADKGGKFIYFNSRFIETFGYTLKDIPTVDDWWTHAYPDEEYRQRVINSWRAAAIKAIKNRGQTERKEWRVRCKDGSSLDIEFRMASLHDVNIVIFNDITERKRAEESIRQIHHELEKAYTDLKAAQSQMLHQEKMASIGQLSAGIAHEIKNPLGIIVQGMDALQGSLADNSLADVSEMIKKAALRAAKIVNDLLSFARQSPLALKKRDIVSILEETLSLLEHQLNLRNIRIIRRFDEGSLMALVDSNQIKQVFINVLLNAADAMGRGGAIEIDAGMTVTPAGNSVVHISFSDNGCGIVPENIEKVFDPFFTTKRDSGGTGLGLSVSQRIIENHNGTITMESRVGEGTRVLVALPAPGQ